MKKKQYYILITTFAILLRILLMFSCLSDIVSNSVEVSTPINSYKKGREGIFLLNKRIDPYIGDMVHEMPITLVFLRFIDSFNPILIKLFYILLDVVTAVLLYFTGKEFVESKIKAEEHSKEQYADNIEDIKMQTKDLNNIPNFMYLSYLFNPFGIANCLGMTSTVLSNALLGGFFYCLSKKKLFPCLLLLSIESLKNFYPVVLLAPVIILFSNKSTRSGILISVCFVFISTVVSIINYLIIGSWSFMNGTLGFILFCRDLQPNVGLFWYFFTEMFDHFRSLFLASFQINATILYLIPLSLKLRNDPLILAAILVALSDIFRSYPCLGDICFYLALLPLGRRFWRFLVHDFVVFCFFIISICIMPTLWHLWINSGSANANFFFGATLAFSTGQIFLVTDLLFAYVKRDFSLQNGMKIMVDGKEAKLLLE